MEQGQGSEGSRGWATRQGHEIEGGRETGIGDRRWLTG